MPPCRNRGNGPTRRSERLSKPSRKTKARKQKNSKAEEAEQKVQVLFPKSINGREIDSCCWICHKPGQEQICASCPRVYHNQCLKSTSNEFTSQLGACPECLTESVDGTELPASITKEILRSSIAYIMMKIYAFKVPFEVLKSFAEYSKKVCYQMDIETLVDQNINARYNSTAEFYRDVKWIYHNCYNIFGANAEETIEACKIVKYIKNDLLYLEACHECYTKNSSAELDNAFALLCEKPHRLLWVKLKGYPYWPSKCIKVINGMAHVQFFGTHDRTAVKANTCFLMSEKNPSGKSIQRSAYQNSEDEMKVYIKNYEEKYGPFEYAPPKTVFVPSDDENYVVKKRQEASCSLNVSLSSEVENENSNLDECNNSSQDIEIIDDVEIAESENNPLYESCDIIDVTDEDESENAINNSESGNFENQDESPEHTESTLQGVETSTASPQDRVTIIQEDFASPSFILDMPSPMSQNPSAVFEPSTSGINSSNNPQEEIQSQHRDDADVCYMNERPRARSFINDILRTDLSTLSHSSIRSLVSECEEDVDGLARHFVQNVGHFAHVPKLVQKLLIGATELKAELQKEQDELKELEERSADVDISKFVDSLDRKRKQELEHRIGLEKNKIRDQKFELLRLTRLNLEQHIALRKSKDEKKTSVDQETMTEGAWELSPATAKYYELKRQEMLQEVQIKFEREALHAKTNSWCKKCLNLATIHCCINANYCDENCQKADLLRHTAVCKNPRKLYE